MLREALAKILNEWVEAKKESITEHPLANYIRNNLPVIIREFIKKQGLDFLIKGSPGQGNWADVPWLSILNPKITDSTRQGIYPVYLFCADSSGVYLSLNQGTTALSAQLGLTDAKKKIQRIKRLSREKLASYTDWDFEIIDLKARSALSKSYEEANIIAKFYPTNGLPSENIIVSDLKDIIKIYTAVQDKLKMEMAPSICKPSQPCFRQIWKQVPFLNLENLIGCPNS